MIYAIDGGQSGCLMYRYKSATPGPSHRAIVSSLLTAQPATFGHKVGPPPGSGISPVTWNLNRR